MKFKFTYQGDDIGILYLDSHPRSDKFAHAGHFTMQCGCYTDNQHKDFQIPIAALVCNLSSSNTISHAEVETLFHEFGHALHENNLTTMSYDDSGIPLELYHLNDLNLLSLNSNFLSGTVPSILFQMESLQEL